MNSGAESGVLEDAQIIQQPELFYLLLIAQCFYAAQTIQSQ